MPNLDAVLAEVTGAYTLDEVIEHFVACSEAHAEYYLDGDAE